MPQEIQPEVHVWHGEGDRLIPAPLIRAMANLIPNCQARFLPGEDHFSLVPRCMAQMLRAVVS